MRLFPKPKKVVVSTPKPELAKTKKCCGHIACCGHAPLKHCGHGA